VYSSRAQSQLAARIALQASEGEDDILARILAQKINEKGTLATAL
jgi:hypothetical protein